MKIAFRHLFKNHNSGKYMLSLAVLLAFFLVGMILFYNREPTCAEINKEVEAAFTDIGKNREGYNKAYNILQNAKSCQESSIKNTNTENMEYYFNKAKVEYRLNKINSAQTSANTALAIYDKLLDDDKKSVKNKQIHAELQEIKGTIN